MMHVYNAGPFWQIRWCAVDKCNSLAPVNESKYRPRQIYLGHNYILLWKSLCRVQTFDWKIMKNKRKRRKKSNTSSNSINNLLSLKTRAFHSFFVPSDLQLKKLSHQRFCLLKTKCILRNTIGKSVCSLIGSLSCLARFFRHQMAQSTIVNLAPI